MQGDGLSLDYYLLERRSHSYSGYYKNIISTYSLGINQVSMT